MKDDLRYYINLTQISYLNVVDHLLCKYGCAVKDYYTKNTYTKILSGKIQHPSKTRLSRTSEGLYCHHILENKYINAADPRFIFTQEIPYEAQSKENLVYCNLLEHAIMHVLIAIENTDSMLGIQGYQVFMKPQLESWYIDKKLPRRKWEINCYQASYLSAEHLREVLYILDRLIKVRTPISILTPKKSSIFSSWAERIKAVFN